jgi:hypothetical protein
VCKVYDEGVRKLIAAMINQAIKDIKNNTHREDSKIFLKSEFGELCCFILDLNYNSVSQLTEIQY